MKFIRKKYYFDPDTLSFKKVKTSLSELFRNNFHFVFITLVFAITIFWFLQQNIDNPKERRDKREIDSLNLKIELQNKKVIYLNKELLKLSERDNNLYRPIFDANPNNIQKKIPKGLIEFWKKSFENTPSATKLIKTKNNLAYLQQGIYFQSLSYDKLITLIKDKEKMQASIPNIRPVKLEKIIAICTFGMRHHPLLKIYRMHKGVDLVAPKGTPVMASGNALVIENKFNSGLGNYIMLDHGYGFITVYGHLNKTFVSVGKRVKRGDVIGEVGTTGTSEVDHLHYEVYKNYKAVNPFSLFYNELTDKEFESLIRNSSEAESFYLR